LRNAIQKIGQVRLGLKSSDGCHRASNTTSLN
jgi:hypothetical protein